MNTPALAQDNAAASSDAGMPLRLAQRAFASLIEERAPADVANLTTFRAAQLRGSARRTLSALSADEQPALQRWLSLQLATRATGESDTLRQLARVDAGLATAIAAGLAGTRELLADRAAPADGVAA